MAAWGRRVQARISHGILFMLARTAHRLPLRWAAALGRALGWLAPRLSKRHFRRICAEIAPIFGAAEAPRIATACYRNLGMSLMEFLRLAYMSAADIRGWARLEGAEHIEAALARGKGVILLTAHMGNWEVCGISMGLSPYTTAGIARPQKESALTDLFNRIREMHGLAVIPMADIRACIRTLKRNECLGVLADLNANNPGAFVDFLGRPAATFTGVAYLALTTGATILPIFDERLPDHTHVCRIGAPLPLIETGDRPRDLLINTMRAQQVIENEVRRRPADWYWLEKRWKTRPEKLANPERIPMEHRDLTPEEAAAVRAELLPTAASAQPL